MAYILIALLVIGDYIFTNREALWIAAQNEINRRDNSLCIH